MRFFATAALAAAVAATVLVAAPARASQSYDTRGRISAVTVYPDRAQITRGSRFEVQPGLVTITFNNVPANMQADTVRVTGSGTAVATIHGFDLKNVYIGHPPDKQVAALENKKIALEEQARTLADQRAVHERQLHLLETTAAHAGESLAAQLAAGKSKLSEWKGTVAYLEQEQLNQAKALHDLDLKKKALDHQKRAIDVALAKLRGFRRESEHRVVVTVEVARAGYLDMGLEYVIPGASWSPSYDARLDAAGEHLDWRYYGVVRQQTGENWDDVHLQLSTARPASGSQPPSVPSWFLSLYQPPPPGMAAKAAAGYANNLAQQQLNRAPMPMRAADEETPAPAAEPREATEPEATVTNQGTSVTLDVPREVSIPSDGETHQTPIAHAAFVPKTMYRVIPRYSTDAYLVVDTTHAGTWPIMPGPVKAFVGHDYVGTTQLTQDVVPGQHLTLPLGVDRGILVRRTRLDKTVGEAGLLRKGGFAQYKYEITVTNFKPRAQTIQVIEPVPQSTEELIKIAVDAGTHKPMTGSAPGQQRWELKLGKGEKQTLRWGYRVDFPQGQEPAGLD